MHSRRFAISLVVLAAATVLSQGAVAGTKKLDPLPGQNAGHMGPYVPQYVAPADSGSGTWSPLAQTFPGTGPDTALLLTDGTVLMHDACTPDWYKLTPDNTGSYQNGAWTKAASMQSKYAPLYFASQVLADGRLIVNGGEYNDCKAVWTNLGALYDPVADRWTVVNPPDGWQHIGDAQSVILADGTYMLASVDGKQAKASISKTTVTWTVTGAGKADGDDEEGWTMLPNQTLLTVDTNRDLKVTFNDAEIFSPATGAWSATGNTTAQVVDAGSHEIGPAPLLPNGLVFQIGATGHNSIYDWKSGTWSAAPNMPKIDGLLTSADGPAAVLPNGRILAQLSPGVFGTPSHFVEIAVKSATKTKITQVNEPASAASVSSYEGRMLVLPTGQVLWSNDQGDVQIYTPTGKAKAAWAPVVSSVPATIIRSSTNNVVQGSGFNGLNFGGYYGDDAQMSTNFPLVRITNTASGHVCYARTHDHATMGISTGTPTSTKFDVPANCEAGSSSLVVVANGIASAPKTVTLN